MLLMTAPLLSACASGSAGTANVTVTADPVCKAAVRPICVSANDVLTQKTAVDLVKNNEGMLAACPALRREFQKKKCPTGQVPAAPPEAAKPVKAPLEEPSTS